MALTVQQLLTPMTAAQIRQNAVIALQALGLQPQLWATGSIASSILTVACNTLAALSTQLSNGISAMWNPTATGGDLQLLSLYFYGINPPQATFAQGTLTLTNIGGGVYSYGAGQAFFGNSVANAQGLFAQYTNIGSFTLSAGSPSVPTVLLVPVQCTTIGSAGNANPGFVTLLITQMLGVTATNAAAIVGNDALTDIALRSLNIASLGAQSVYGPRTAYQYAIQTAVNSVTGLPVNVNRWNITPSSHTGDITIIVASPAGPVITTDLQGISNRIEQIARPEGVTVLPGLPGYPSAPASASTVPYVPAITAYVLAATGTTAAQVQTVCENALTVWFEGPNNPIGGLTASDDSVMNFTGIFESGVIGIIGQAIATIPQCYLLSTQFVGVSDLPLTPGAVAVNATTLAVNIQYST